MVGYKIYVCLRYQNSSIYFHRMKTTTATAGHHRIRPISVSIILILFPEIINLAGAQSWSQSPPNQPYATFTPSLAIIIAVLVAGLFFMGFFSIYIRHCGDTNAGGGAVRRAISLRNRRAAAARGLDASVIEMFPTFSYSEVKDHHIGKDALECAVCLNEFEDDETLRLIPKCDHVFHPECIDAWLESHVTCPVCRANLVPLPGDELVQLPNPVENPTDNVNNSMERTDSRNEEVVIDVDANEQTQRPEVKRNTSFEYANQLRRSWSVKMFGFGKFRSRSTGHSLIQLGENIDRFTLKLPAQVRKDMMNRASLSRIGSYASTTLPREGSSRRGYRGEGSIRTGRSYSKVDREAKSDRWVFFSRGLSMKSPKVVAETGQGSSHGGSGSSRHPVKYPSFKCLEPKAADETVLFSDDQLAKNSV